MAKRETKKSNRRILVVSSDWHAGNTLGLMNPKTEMYEEMRVIILVRFLRSMLKGNGLATRSEPRLPVKVIRTPSQGLS